MERIQSSEKGPELPGAASCLPRRPASVGRGLLTNEMLCAPYVLYVTSIFDHAGTVFVTDEDVRLTALHSAACTHFQSWSRLVPKGQLIAVLTHQCPGCCIHCQLCR